MAGNLGVKVTENGKYYFISYNTEDQDLISKYVKRMDEMGIPVWYDFGLKVGKKWEIEIAEHIKNCEAVILFVSKNIFLKEKSYVNKEYKIATEYFQKDIYVIMIDDIDKHEVPVRYISWWIELDNLQCVHAYNCASVNDCVDQIAAAINFTPKNTKPSYKELLDLISKLEESDVNALGLNVLKNKQAELDVDNGKPQKVKIAVDKKAGIPIKLLKSLPAKNSGIEHISKMIEGVFARYKNYRVKVCEVSQGPRYCKFYLQVERGVSFSKLASLIFDVELETRVEGLRMEMDYVKNMPFIEFPTPQRTIVPLYEMVESSANNDYAKKQLLIPMGEDSDGKLIFEDLCKMPHLLVAGATGMGKSIFINGVLVSLMMKYTPNDVRFVLIDTKMVEFKPFEGSPFLLNDCIANNVGTVKQTFDALKNELNTRYKAMSSAQVRNVNEYNQFALEHGLERMPKIVVVVDEISDWVYWNKNVFEDAVRSITQLGRAAGIYFILTTQRPSVDVITGSIKANVPSRIAFKVVSQIDSRTILEESGAERLNGKGELLYKTCSMVTYRRCQSAYVSYEEVCDVIEYTKEYARLGYYNKEYVKQHARLDNNKNEPIEDLEREILKFAIENKNITLSGIQRNFGIGYPKAARIISNLKENGYIEHKGKYYVPTIDMESFIQKFI